MKTISGAAMAATTMAAAFLIALVAAAPSPQGEANRIKRTKFAVEI